jgi:hypothetical protein
VASTESTLFGSLTSSCISRSPGGSSTSGANSSRGHFTFSFRPDLPNNSVSGITSSGDVDTAIDYKAHYYANHRAFFILFGLFPPVDIVDSLLKGVPHFLALGPAYFISSSLYFACLITAAITRNERYHEFYAVFFFLQTVVIRLCKAAHPRGTARPIAR